MGRKIVYLPTDFELNPDLAVEGFTQSEMQMLDDCPQKWDYRYNQMIQRKGELNWASLYGGWIHASLEEWYNNKCKHYSWEPTYKKKLRNLTLDQRREQEYWEALGKVQMAIYTSYYKNDRKVFDIMEGGVEHIVDIDFKTDGWTFRLKGMIDLLLYHQGRKGLFTMDHKTSTRLDRGTIMGWSFRFQFMFYCWLAHKKWPKLKIKGWIPNGFKKSMLRWNHEKEGLEEHMHRVKADMIGFPEKYFYREPLPFTKAAIENFEVMHLRPKLLKLKMLMDPKTPMEVKIAIGRNTNSNHCVKYGEKYACPYLPLCDKGQDLNMFLYERREHKHEELQEELE